MVHPSDDVNSVAHSLTSRRGKEIAVMTFLNGDSRLFALSLSLSLLSNSFIRSHTFRV